VKKLGTLLWNDRQVDNAFEYEKVDKITMVVPVVWLIDIHTLDMKEIEKMKKQISARLFDYLLKKPAWDFTKHRLFFVETNWLTKDCVNLTVALRAKLETE